MDLNSRVVSVDKYFGGVASVVVSIACDSERRSDDEVVTLRVVEPF